MAVLKIVFIVLVFGGFGLVGWAGLNYNGYKDKYSDIIK